MAAARDLDMVQQWRKTFRYAQPPIPGDRLDAMRFAEEFVDNADAEMLTDGYTLGDVARGIHRGGADPNADALPGGQARAGALNKCRARRKVLKGELAKYFSNDKTLWRALKRASLANDAAHGEFDGEFMWAEYKRLQIGEPTEARAEKQKKEIREATILGLVGQQEESILLFTNKIQELNEQIEPDALRMSEHDLSVVLLQALAACGVVAVAGDAVKEYNCPPANRQYQQVAAPNNERSLTGIRDAFNRQWRGLYGVRLIDFRGPGGTAARTGNSTRVDAHEVEAEDTDESLAELFELTMASAGEVPMKEMRDAFIAAVKQRGYVRGKQAPRLTRERLCWMCMGGGHTKNGDPSKGIPPCPSSPNSARTIDTMLNLLTEAKALQMKRGQMPAGETTLHPGKAKTPGWWTRNDGARKVQAYVTEDGAIRDEDAMQIGMLYCSTFCTTRDTTACVPEETFRSQRLPAASRQLTLSCSSRIGVTAPGVTPPLPPGPKQAGP
jgi:hypothetical protein